MPVLLDRRSFLSAAAGTGTALTLPSSAFGAAVDAPECVHGIVDELTLEETLLNGAVAPACPTASGWEPDKLFNQSAATMVWAGRARGAGKSELDKGELAEAIDARMDGMVRTLWAAGLELDAMDSDEVEELERAIREEPWILEEARLNFTASALENDVSMRQVKQVDRLFERTLWRVNNQGLEAVRQDLLGRLDKAAKRDGVDWRAEGRAGAKKPFVRPVTRKEAPREAQGELNRRPKPPFDSPAEYEALARRQKSTGGWALGIGILWMAGPQIIFGGICFGPPLITLGIIKLVKAGKHRRTGEALKRRLEAE
ncbi:MAG: hypothetical protein KC912_18070 [Proteobacteria bacterium]|nr:hypothetical protein [Pseudomonadota bacterium]